MVFLSTPSARRATGSARFCAGAWWHFYPRPPRGGRRQGAEKGVHVIPFLSTPSARRATDANHHDSRRSRISIHALREEGDFGGFDLIAPRKNFYPRPPRGGRQKAPAQSGKSNRISIHALREEGDKAPARSPPQSANFYPRPPRGGRRSSALIFSSPSMYISIHALREEGDGQVYPAHPRCPQFLSTPSARRATVLQ